MSSYPGSLPGEPPFGTPEWAVWQEPIYEAAMAARSKKRRRSSRHRGKALSRRQYTNKFWEIIAMKKPEGSVGGSTSPPGKGELLSQCPHLFELLTEDHWDDGSARELATIMVFRKGGHMTLCINDKALGRTGFTGGITLEEAFLRAELSIEDGSMDWRTTAPQKKK